MNFTVLFGRHHYRMAQLRRRIRQTGADIGGLQVRKITQNLGLAYSVRQHFQDVGNANPHPPYAGSAVTLFGANGYPRKKFGVHQASLHPGATLRQR